MNPMQRSYKDFMNDWNYDDPVNTRTIFLQHLQTAQEENDQETVSEIQTQIARTYSLNLEFNQAHTILDKVEKVLPVLPSPILQIRYYLERGRTYNSSHIRDRAIFCFKNAMSVSLCSLQR